VFSSGVGGIVLVTAMSAGVKLEACFHFAAGSPRRPQGRDSHDHQVTSCYLVRLPDRTGVTEKEKSHDVTFRGFPARRGVTARSSCGFKQSNIVRLCPTALPAGTRLLLSNRKMRALDPKWCACAHFAAVVARVTRRSSSPCRVRRATSLSDKEEAIGVAGFAWPSRRTRHARRHRRLERRSGRPSTRC
jgi:hypothetical protein